MTVHKTAGGVEYEQHEPENFARVRKVEVPARVDAEQTARLVVRLERLIELAEQERDFFQTMERSNGDLAAENYRRVKAAENKIDELAAELNAWKQGSERAKSSVPDDQDGPEPAGSGG